MNNDYYKIYNLLNNTDLSVRELQLNLKKIENLQEYSDLIAYNKYLEQLRSDIHLKIKELNF